LKAGAVGYLTKESAPDELIMAIRRIASGKKYISAAVAEQLASHRENGSGELLHDKLSNREYKVMNMIAYGKRIREIAEELSLSGKTISTYRSRILQKLRLKNNSEIMRYCVRNRTN
jgi:DNA-binding NarL/FixJ family response regulator